MIRGAVARPVAVLMLFTGLVLIGALAFRRLPVDLLPAINYPNLTVITNYVDVPADDLARLVTQPLEEAITGLEGVRRVLSRTREGVSTVTVQYEWGTDMDFANLHLREALDRVTYRQDWPESAERPLILRWDPGARPVGILVLEGAHRLAAMTEFAREVAKPALEQIQGVSQAEVIGGLDREILVEPDFGKLRLYGLTIEDLRTSLQTANVSFPGGRIREGPLRLPLRILGEFGSLDDIRRTEIVRGDRRLTVADVATVLDTTREPEGMTLDADREVVSLHLYKEIGANTIDTTREVDRVLAVLAGDYPDFSFRWIHRDADYVQASFNGLRDSLLYGAALAFLVLFVFLRDVRSPAIVGLSIPVSVCATFAFLYFARVNLNLMSLGGLSLAAGMLVDNAIVVLENINRHLRERPGGDVGTTAARATAEVALAVGASTLTTIAVFFPVIYVPGIAGEFFRDQALTVTCSLLVSILTALLLQPTLSARFLSARPHEPRGLYRVSDAFFVRLHDVYRASLARVLERRAWLFAGVLLAVGAAALVAATLPRSFMPARSAGDFTAAVELPAGTPIEQTRAVASELGRWLSGRPEVSAVYSQVGTTERTLAALREYTAPNTLRLRVLVRPGRRAAARTETLRRDLDARLSALGGAAWAYREEGVGLREILASGEAAFTLGVVADRPEDALAAADLLLPLLRQVPGLAGVEMDRVLGNPTVEATVDREKALRFGLEPDALARELRARVQGVVATYYDEFEQRVDVAVRLPRDDRQDLEGVLASPVAVAPGKTVPLGAFVALTEGRPVREVVRWNQRRQITLSGDVEGRGVGAVWQDVRRLLARQSLPEGVSLVVGGEQEEIRGSFHDLLWALALSLLLIYMILAAQYESFLDPVLIAAVLPVGLLGAVFALAVSGQGFNIMSLIGIIALCGIVVNNAILAVDTARRLRRDGLPGRAAVLTAAQLRLRPILMTTLTTVVGMIPMAIGLGSGEQIQRPLAIAIMGGLTVGTVVTLYLTPALYEAAHGRRDPRWRAPAAPGGPAS